MVFLSIILEQGIWFQDFPKKTATKSQENKSDLAEDFENTLVDYLRRLDFDLGFKIDEFDFSEVKVKLISCVPGTHKGRDLHKYGHMKLRKELSKIHISKENKKNSQVLCQVSLTSHMDFVSNKRNLFQSFQALDQFQKNGCMNSWKVAFNQMAIRKTRKSSVWCGRRLNL